MIQKKYFLPLLIAMTCLPAIANEWASREELEQKQLEVARKWQNAKQPVQPNSSYSSPTSSTITNINQIRPNSHLGQSSVTSPIVARPAAPGRPSGRLSQGFTTSNTFEPPKPNKMNTYTPLNQRIKELKAEKNAQVLRWQQEQLMGQTNKPQPFTYYNK